LRRNSLRERALVRWEQMCKDDINVGWHNRFCEYGIPLSNLECKGTEDFDNEVGENLHF